MIPLSARSEEQLNLYAEQVKDFIKKIPVASIGNLAYTYQIGRKEFPFRKVLLASYQLDEQTTPEIIEINSQDSNNDKIEDFILRFIEPATNWCKGIKINWTKWNPEGEYHKIHVPTYPFSRKAYQLPQKKNEKKIQPEEKTSSENTELRQLSAKDFIWDALQEILGEDTIEFDMTFIELGGDSLMAIELSERLKEYCNADFSLDFILDSTIQKLIDKAEESCQSTKREEKSSSKCIIQHTDNIDYPLTPAQQQMYFLTEAGENKSLYNLPGAILLRGKLDTIKFKDALQYVVEKHEQLRAVFRIKELEVRQQILPRMECNCEIIDAQDEYAVKGTELIRNYLRKEEQHIFHLNDGAMFHFQLLKLKESEYCFLMNFHHIIFDAYSMDIFLTALDEAYKGLTEHTLNRELSKITNVQYTDYALWMEKMKTQEDYLQAREYWKKQFSNGIPKLNLPVEHENNKKHLGCSQFLIFDQETVSGLKEFNKQLNTTMYQTLFGAFVLLLKQYTGQQEIVVGTSSSGRISYDTLNMIGMFVNTLPLSFQVRGNEKLEDFILYVKDIILNGIANQIYPYPNILEDAKNRNKQDTAMLNVNAFFSLEHPVEKGTKHLMNMETESIDFLSTRALFDLALNVSEGNAEIKVEITYDTALFGDTTMKYWLWNYECLVKNLITQRAVSVENLFEISTMEKQFLLQTYNDTSVPLKENTFVMDLIREQMERQPDAIAIDYDGEKVSYGKLNHMVDILCKKLTSVTCIYQKPVIILLERSVQMIVSILAVLRAGGHYVPIDPGYPIERIQNILEITKHPFVITQESYEKYCSGCDYVSFQMKNPLDITLKEKVAADTVQVQNEMVITAEDLAYIIFTSGSSGRPKGVMIKHKGFVNYVNWAVSYYNAGTDGDFPLYSSIAFDLTITSVFIPLAAGRTIYIQPEHLSGIELIAHMVKEVKLSSIKITPAHLEIILQIAKYSQQMIGTLKHVVVGGEPLPPSLVNEWFQFYPDTIIYNEYGPTETVVGCIVQKITKQDIPIQNQYVPIGTPIQNTRIYILNKDKNMVPMGAVGEIYIAGNGVAKGYYGEEDRNKNSFSHIALEEETVYKTGDLARFRNDGTLEHLGRCDDQVKIRGFRIELGEIEQVLLNYSTIQNVIVLQHENTLGQKILLTFFTATESISNHELHDYVERQLPAYMIPNEFLQVDEIPLTINGKVDRKKLIQVYESDAPSKEQKSETNSENVYQLVLQTWMELFHNTMIYENDSFFELGGNSLMVLPMISRLKAYFPNIQINDIFNYPVLKEFVAHISQEGKKGQVKDNLYAESLKPFVTKQKPVVLYENSSGNHTILLTGATGFLGAYILNELINQEETEIYCLVRTKNYVSAAERLKTLMVHYFSDSATGLEEKVHVLEGDLEKEQLGLSKDSYQELLDKIDCMIHCAADVRHYGAKNSNYQTNVKGTERLLALAEMKKGMSFHYISTISIGNELTYLIEQGQIHEERFHLGEMIDNDYLESKYQSECMVYKAMDKGIPAVIYRVGNLVGNSKDGIFQTNIESNAFYNLIKGIVQLHAAPDDKSFIELTPVDYAAKAITTLVMGQKTYGGIYHICNPKPIRFLDFITLMQSLAYPIAILNKERFREYLYSNMEDQNHAQWSSCILMAYEPSDDSDIEMTYDCRKTIETLTNYSITCPEINRNFISSLFEYMISVDFIPASGMWEWLKRER